MFYILSYHTYFFKGRSNYYKTLLEKGQVNMDLDIRKAILHNIRNNSKDELEATIVDAINDGEEKMLPGLGFLFELIWKQADENERIEMVDVLEKGVKSTSLS